jgi:hypothetical protein
MNKQPNLERFVEIHTAGTWTEAMVIRGLLESAGMDSPGSVSTDPFPLREPPKGTHGTEIFVLESNADRARALIEEYLAGNKNDENPDSSDPEANEND